MKQAHRGSLLGRWTKAIACLIFALMVTLLFAADIFSPATSLAAGTKLAGPVFWGSPDQPYGVRRPVTDKDHILIQKYRSKQPLYSTTFTSADEFQTNWTCIEDDNPDLKSCRRSGNVETSSNGLNFKTLISTDSRAKWSTGFITSKAQYTYGFFEARIKIADIKGMNNAFWMTTADRYEIDIGEIQYPNYSHFGMQYWSETKPMKHTGLGFGANFTDNLYDDYHDYGVLWTPTEIIYEVDGEPIAALLSNNSVKGSVSVKLSTALGEWAHGPVPEHPEGHGMMVKSLRIVPLDSNMQ